jgi:pyruvate,water dikinase
MLAEIGRRLCNQGVVCSPVDVFYLTLEEALTALKDGSTKSLNDSVSQRRNERDKNSKLIPPAYLGTVPEDGPAATVPESQAMLGPTPDFNAEQEPSVLRGTGGAAGSITGPAKVVRSPDEFGKIRPGDILVCTSTSPTWTPLFGTIAALVSDSGGVLSHTAIVAREYGLPAVVGVRNGTRRITDGQIITVDGDKGLVLLR